MISENEKIVNRICFFANKMNNYSKVDLTDPYNLIEKQVELENKSLEDIYEDIFLILDSLDDEDYTIEDILGEVGEVDE